MTDHRRLLNSLILLATVGMLVPLGPAVRTRTVALTCDEVLLGDPVFEQMNECSVARANAADEGRRCVCLTRTSWVAPLYYLELLPLAFISATWFISRPAPRAVARGMAAVGVVLASTILVRWPVMVLYDSGFDIPELFESMAIDWPGYVFFGGSLRTTDGDRVLYQGSGVFTLTFWILVAIEFGILTWRLKSFSALLVLAAVFVGAAMMVILWMVPALDWRFPPDFP